MYQSLRSSHSWMVVMRSGATQSRIHNIRRISETQTAKLQTHTYNSHVAGLHSSALTSRRLPSVTLNSCCIHPHRQFLSSHPGNDVIHSLPKYSPTELATSSHRSFSTSPSYPSWHTSLGGKTFSFLQHLQKLTSFPSHYSQAKRLELQLHEMDKIVNFEHFQPSARLIAPILRTLEAIKREAITAPAGSQEEMMALIENALHKIVTSALNWRAWSRYQRNNYGTSYHSLLSASESENRLIEDLLEFCLYAPPNSIASAATASHLVLPDTRLMNRIYRAFVYGLDHMAWDEATAASFQSTNSSSATAASSSSSTAPTFVLHNYRPPKTKEVNEFAFQAVPTVGVWIRLLKGYARCNNLLAVRHLLQRVIPREYEGTMKRYVSFTQRLQMLEAVAWNFRHATTSHPHSSSAHLPANFEKEKLQSLEWVMEQLDATLENHVKKNHYVPLLTLATTEPLFHLHEAMLSYSIDSLDFSMLHDTAKRLNEMEKQRRKQVKALSDEVPRVDSLNVLYNHRFFLHLIRFYSKAVERAEHEFENHGMKPHAAGSAPTKKISENRPFMSVDEAALSLFTLQSTNLTTSPTAEASSISPLLPHLAERFVEIWNQLNSRIRDIDPDVVMLSELARGLRRCSSFSPNAKLAADAVVQRMLDSETKGVNESTLAATTTPRKFLAACELQSNAFATAALPDADAIRSIISSLYQKGITPSTRIYNDLLLAFLSLAKNAKLIESQDPYAINSASAVDTRSTVDYFALMQETVHEMNNGAPLSANLDANTQTSSSDAVNTTTAAEQQPSNSKKIRADAYTYLSLIRAHRFMYQQAEVECIKQKQSFDASAHLPSLLSLYEDMVFTLDPSTINTDLINTFLRGFAELEPSNSEFSLQLFHTALSNGRVNSNGDINPTSTWPNFIPNNLTFEIMIQDLCKRNQVESALNCYSLWVKLSKAQRKKGSPVVTSAGSQQHSDGAVSSPALIALLDTLTERIQPASASFTSLFRTISRLPKAERQTYLPVVSNLFTELIAFDFPITYEQVLLLFRSQVQLGLEAGVSHVHAYLTNSLPHIIKQTRMAKHGEFDAHLRMEMIRFAVERNQLETVKQLHQQYSNIEVFRRAGTSETELKQLDCWDEESYFDMLATSNTEEMFTAVMQLMPGHMSKSLPNRQKVLQAFMAKDPCFQAYKKWKSQLMRNSHTTQLTTSTQIDNSFAEFQKQPEYEKSKEEQAQSPKFSYQSAVAHITTHWPKERLLRSSAIQPPLLKLLNAKYGKSDEEAQAAVKSAKTAAATERRNATSPTPRPSTSSGSPVTPRLKPQSTSELRARPQSRMADVPKRMMHTERHIPEIIPIVAPVHAESLSTPSIASDLINSAQAAAFDNILRSAPQHESSSNERAFETWQKQIQLCTSVHQVLDNATAYFYSAGLTHLVQPYIASLTDKQKQFLAPAPSQFDFSGYSSVYLKSRSTFIPADFAVQSAQRGDLRVVLTRSLRQMLVIDKQQFKSENVQLIVDFFRAHSILIRGAGAIEFLEVLFQFLVHATNQSYAALLCLHHLMYLEPKKESLLAQIAARICAPQNQLHFFQLMRNLSLAELRSAHSTFAASVQQTIATDQAASAQLSESEPKHELVTLQSEYIRNFGLYIRAKNRRDSDAIPFLQLELQLQELWQNTQRTTLPQSEEKTKVDFGDRQTHLLNQVKSSIRGVEADANENPRLRAVVEAWNQAESRYWQLMQEMVKSPEYTSAQLTTTLQESVLRLCSSEACSNEALLELQSRNLAMEQPNVTADRLSNNTRALLSCVVSLTSHHDITIDDNLHAKLIKRLASLSSFVHKLDISSFFGSESPNVLLLVHEWLLVQRYRWQQKVVEARAVSGTTESNAEQSTFAEAVLLRLNPLLERFSKTIRESASAGNKPAAELMVMMYVNEIQHVIHIGESQSYPKSASSRELPTYMQQVFPMLDRMSLIPGGSSEFRQIGLARCTVNILMELQVLHYSRAFDHSVIQAAFQRLFQFIRKQQLHTSESLPQFWLQLMWKVHSSDVMQQRLLAMKTIANRKSNPDDNFKPTSRSYTFLCNPLANSLVDLFTSLQSSAVTTTLSTSNYHTLIQLLQHRDEIHLQRLQSLVTWMERNQWRQQQLRHAKQDQASTTPVHIRLARLEESHTKLYDALFHFYTNASMLSHVIALLELMRFHKLKRTPEMFMLTANLAEKQLARSMTVNSERFPTASTSSPSPISAEQMHSRGQQIEIVYDMMLAHFDIEPASSDFPLRPTSELFSKLLQLCQFGPTSVAERIWSDMTRVASSKSGETAGFGLIPNAVQFENMLEVYALNHDLERCVEWIAQEDGKWIRQFLKELDLTSQELVLKRLLNFISFAAFPLDSFQARKILKQWQDTGMQSTVTGEALRLVEKIRSQFATQRAAANNLNHREPENVEFK